MNELSFQKEKVRQLAGLLKITELPADRRLVRAYLRKNRARLVLRTFEGFFKSLAGAGVAARDKMLPPAR